MVRTSPLKKPKGQAQINKELRARERSKRAKAKEAGRTRPAEQKVVQQKPVETPADKPGSTQFLKIGDKTAGPGGVTTTPQTQEVPKERFSASKTLAGGLKEQFLESPAGRFITGEPQFDPEEAKEPLDPFIVAGLVTPLGKYAPIAQMSDDVLRGLINAGMKPAAKLSQKQAGIIAGSELKARLGYGKVVKAMSNRAADIIKVGMGGNAGKAAAGKITWITLPTGQILGTNTKTAALTSSYLQRLVAAASKPAVALGIIGTTLFTSLFWGPNEKGDALTTLGIAMRDAVDAGDTALVKEIGDTIQETSDIIAQIPLVGFTQAEIAKVEAALLASKASNAKVKALLGEGTAQDIKWNEIRETQMADEQRSRDDWDRRKKDLVQWEIDAREEGDEDSAKLWRKERERERELEREEMKEIAKFWLDYRREVAAIYTESRKQAAKFYEETAKSRLKFGIL